MFERIFFIAACLLLPVVWGVLVNWIFDLWQQRSTRNDDSPGSDDEPIFPDYQI